MPVSDRPLRFLFSFARGRGHLGPLVPIARAAAASGHATALIGARDPVLDQKDFGQLHPRDVPMPPSGEGTGVLTPVNPSNVLKNMAPFFLGEAARIARDYVTELAAEWAADVVVCDGQDFGAMVAAERLGIPVVVVEVFATASDEWVDSIRGPMQEFRAEAGLEPDPELRMIDGTLTVVPFPPSLRGTEGRRAEVIRMRPEPPELSHAHPALRWLAAGDEEHRVYVTLGTAFNKSSGDLLPRILKALESLPIRALITTGPRLDPGLFPVASARLRVEQYVPQDGILGLVDLTITHGGSGSVTGSLSRGVPVLVLPLGADQLPNGQRATSLGAGAVMDAATATPAEIASETQRLLASSPVREAARTIQAEISELPSADAVVQRIAELVR